jgi:hypothetical protein
MGKEARMKNRVSKWSVLALGLAALTACVVATGPRGGVEVVPVLPAVVELDVEPYYTYEGYVYFYSGDRWLYSTSRNGPWTELPRSHWPRETRRRGWERRR